MQEGREVAEELRRWWEGPDVAAQWVSRSLATLPGSEAAGALSRTVVVVVLPFSMSMWRMSCWQLPAQRGDAERSPFVVLCREIRGSEHRVPVLWPSQVVLVLLDAL